MTSKQMRHTLSTFKKAFIKNLNFMNKREMEILMTKLNLTTTMSEQEVRERAEMDFEILSIALFKEPEIKPFEEEEPPVEDVPMFVEEPKPEPVKKIKKVKKIKVVVKEPETYREKLNDIKKSEKIRKEKIESIGDEVYIGPVLFELKTNQQKSMFNAMSIKAKTLYEKYENAYLKSDRAKLKKEFKKEIENLRLFLS